MFYSVICESNLLQHKHLGVYPINRIDRWGLEWRKTGEFQEDYSKEPNATVDKHLGEDWQYHNDETGKETTKDTDILSITDGRVVDVQNDRIRVQTNGGRIDYIHINGSSVKVNDNVKTGDKLADGADNHLHVAKNYEAGNVPNDSGPVEHYDGNGRDYVNPPDPLDPKKGNNSENIKNR